MCETLGFIVKAPATGGWNKQHIWKVMANENAGIFAPLCSNGRRNSPQRMTVNRSWAVANVNSRGISLSDDETPLEKYDHHCDKCQAYWFTLRTLEGHTSQGVFAIGGVVDY